MTGGNFSRRVTAEQNDAAPEGAPLGGTKSEARQRLQVGFGGIAAMILLVGLASVLGSQADQTEEDAVPDAAPTTEPTEAPAQRDPLADAGIVPDVPAEPAPAPTTVPDTGPLGQTPQNQGQPANGAPQN
ncbi:hypothetical protein [Sulfitobacter sp.]|uniref:hypothetical protein n=1 Tax=Sulfitobacter sp. TaxID=1903071 RepID=UPI003EF17DA7